jgi:hypothetical protein
MVLEVLYRPRPLAENPCTVADCCQLPGEAAWASSAADKEWRQAGGSEEETLPEQLKL